MASFQRGECTTSQKWRWDSKWHKEAIENLWRWCAEYASRRLQVWSKAWWLSLYCNRAGVPRGGVKTGEIFAKRMGDIYGSNDEDAADRTIVYKDMDAPPSHKVENAHTVDNAPGRLTIAELSCYKLLSLWKLLKVMIIILIICNNNDNNNTLRSIEYYIICICEEDYILFLQFWLVEAIFACPKINLRETKIVHENTKIGSRMGMIPEIFGRTKIRVPAFQP